MGEPAERRIDTEPLLAELLAARVARRAMPPYLPKTDAAVAEQLTGFFAQVQPGAAVSEVGRLGGGASKEQFSFTLRRRGEEPRRYVLRMDPLEAITETHRRREYESLRAFQGRVPAPVAAWLDDDGRHFGRPALIMELVAGTAKPTSDAAVKVSGLGTQLGERLRGLLRPQFLDHLVAIHALDWRKAELPSFTPPLADARQPARWQLEYWAELWRQDATMREPIMAVAETWMRANLPEARELVFVHGDYRTGNYLFDEASGRITALLDWELAYLGDYHDDLAWVIQRIFGTITNGTFRASDLYEREEFLHAYERATGRRVDRRALHFYEVLSAYKCIVIVTGTGIAVSRAAHNHQAVLLTFLASAGPIFRSELCRLLEQEVSA
jgi:aminoglycoside phosphotransferase (APT) family kinase protein